MTSKKIPFSIRAFILLLFIPVSQVFGQNRVVTGVVSSGTDNSVSAGVSVFVKGTTNGVLTGSDGRYSVTVPGSSAVLIFSSAEFRTQEIAVGNETEINVVLISAGGNLAEIVVVGYGTQQRRAVTNAITTVNPEQFNKGNISNVAQLLQGKVAGLSISKPGGDPNGSFSIRLRGLSSLGNVQPLIIVDNLVGADLNSVDPNDIKSIDILKDGSAAAIYGTRGSAGVIIITTKSGSRGAAQITYNGSVSLEDPFRFTPHMTADQFKALGKGTDYKANTDWNKEITRTAFSHTHNLSISGGNSSGGTYNASINYRKADGVAITTGFEQVNERLNLSQKALKDKLQLNLSITSTKRNSDIGFPEAFKYATIYNPTSPVHTADPLLNPSGSGYFEIGAIDYSNPVAALEQNKHQSEIKRLNLIGSAEYEILKGLKFLVRYGQQSISNYEVAYLPRTSSINRNFLGNISGFARGGYGYKGDFESFNRLYENTLSYDTKIRTWKASFLAGYSYQYYLNQGFSAQGGNFVTDLTADNLNTALDFANGLGTVNSYKNGYKLIAFFGRMNINFDDIVFLQASLRREGSTQFGKNNQWGMFPAVSAAADLTKIIKIHVDNLKLRASYGITGSLPPNSYLSLQTLSAGGSSFYAGNNIYLQAYGPNKNANPDLKWERKAELDLGLDFGLLNDRLSGSFDYYNRTTSDLIFQVTVPSPPALSTTSYLNIGTLKSSGIELALNYDVLKNKTGFSWTTGVNFSTYNVKLAKLDPKVAGSYVGATNLGTPGQEATQITRAVEGQPIGILWGKIFTGVDKTTGLSTFKDLNGDGLIDQKDETKIGNGLPDFEFGWTNTLKYKKFDLSFFLRGSIGHDIINTFRAFYENPNVASTYNVINTKYFDPTLKDPSPKFSSLFVEKGSFVKMDNATLGYTVDVSKKSFFKSLRAYITGQNLFMITKYTGVDPEVRYADPGSSTTAPLIINVLAPGVDRRETWVLTRTFTFGINLGL